MSVLSQRIGDAAPLEATGPDTMLNGNGSSDAVPSPYRGLDSYDVADADLFFGREREAENLVARILSSRISVLYAPSGAGKTSLLNARVIPALESRGLQAVRVRLDNDPVEAIRHATCRYLFPPPALEVRALLETCQQLGITPEEPLQEVHARYDALLLSDTRRRSLVSPVDAPPSAGFAFLDAGSVTPYWARTLRGSVSIDNWRDHLIALVAGDEAEDGSRVDDAEALEEGITRLRITSRVSHLLSLFRSAAMAELYRRRVSACSAGPMLVDFFRALDRSYGRYRADFLVVLILDQFEELFTRFGDPGALTAPTQDVQDWRRREDLFEQLECLLAERDAGAGEDSERLPLRFVLSTREEYVGRLDRIALFAPAITDSMFRLGFLPPDEATLAITSPPSDFDYSYTPEAVDAIVTTLQREQFVEPGPLSMVCNEIWKRLVRADAAPSHHAHRVITLDDLNAPPHCGVQGLVSLFLNGFFSGLDPLDRTDALEMLERLIITSTRTRNIVDEVQLVDVPFRSPKRRQRVLDRLVERKLLRREKRLGALFVEITHEVLIPPLMERVLEEARAARVLRAAQRTLEGIASGDPPELDLTDFRALDRSSERIEWPGWATELMLRSAVIHGADPARLRYWSAKYREATWPTFFEMAVSRDADGAHGSAEGAEDPGRTAGDDGTPSSRFAALAELRRLEDRDARALPRELREQVVRSLLIAGDRNDRARLTFWTRSLGPS